jgi:hypothetical protein
MKTEITAEMSELLQANQLITIQAIQALWLSPSIAKLPGPIIRNAIGVVSRLLDGQDIKGDGSSGSAAGKGGSSAKVTVFEPNPDLVASLMAMGFPRARAIRALTEVCRCSFEPLLNRMHVINNALLVQPRWWALLDIEQHRGGD